MSDGYHTVSDFNYHENHVWLVRFENRKGFAQKSSSGFSNMGTHAQYATIGCEWDGRNLSRRDYFDIHKHRVWSLGLFWNHWSSGRKVNWTFKFTAVKLQDIGVTNKSRLQVSAHDTDSRKTASWCLARSLLLIYFPCCFRCVADMQWISLCSSTILALLLKIETLS